jgi:hypothetical protein
MGNCIKPTVVSVDKAEVKSVVGTCGCERFMSTCCTGPTEAEQKKEHDQAEMAKEIERALRYGRNSSDHELLKMIRAILDQTGQIPDVVFTPHGAPMPAVSKRTLSIRVHDLSPASASENSAQGR